MESKKDTWPLLSFKEYETDINPVPTYQRSSVWKPEQKQMLIDSILRKIEIPKIYLREINQDGYQFEIIDGQQRMRAIWDFLNNQYSLSEEAEPLLVRGKMYMVSEKNYDELEQPIKVERIHKYNLDIVIIYDATEDEIADLFHRLNNGTPLSTAEVRNSMPGVMKNTIKLLSKHPFLSKVSFSNRRFIHDQICAQMMLLELNNGLADTRDISLSKMYSDYNKSVPKSAVENINSALDTLNKIFPDSSRLLNRASTINLYLVISYLLKTTKLTKAFYKRFLDWYLQTEPLRRKDSEYKFYMLSSANSRNSIEERFRMLMLSLYNKFPEFEIIELDPKRIFDETQKTEIFARDKGICKICSRKVTEHTWHADHIKPWIKGGKTINTNGQVLCVKCNLQKKDKLW
ncbi:MAG: DUF262 domain-containing protein [Ignavibacteriaceae bacterium]|nr:DUF262 domain-containing protein [Ignavibacterium sp.]MCC6255226.1 DUF262 domain-containing protein [Ignavibacteriaceae bacterium]HMN25201.1 DUF262 domain-containing protein [Ignavibacteriaceae bacterium]HRN26132.1 DUF262 domain-containing protein [Ignavibacteriaceae bacterium]HRP93804.1 DUF262 domain-containing protein [Ignavibacteriaceae bacterium]